MKQIVLVFRKPFEGQISIEYLFYNLSAYLKRGNVEIVNKQLSYYSKGLLNRLRNLFSITAYKEKIIHVTGDVHYTILGAWFCKRVLTIHDLGFMLNKSPAARLIYWLIWVYLPVKFAHRVTVVSETTRQDLLKYVKVDETKIAVIGNFVDEIYQPFLKPVKKTPTVNLLQIGTTPNKNIDRLLQAIEGLDCTLTIVGKLPENILIQLKARQINYINKYDLTINELYEEFKKSDILCYTSTHEGFGMPILEAQAAGIPVICSNCSSMPEVAADGAYFVDPYDISSIRAGIEKLAADNELKNNLIAKGFLNTKRFSKASIAQQYLNIYQNL
ncbi:glycosyltransferase family 4 protein [Mucilaginibacter litoreus]|uniref:Glycosyltransferase family 4 protein n=1 Tax=Mucilaginibacter litoreus TaxID=1048221 RepID=A0ABW3ALU9_9SPHI